MELRVVFDHVSLNFDGCISRCKLVFQTSTKCLKQPSRLRLVRFDRLNLRINDVQNHAHLVMLLLLREEEHRPVLAPEKTNLSLVVIFGKFLLFPFLSFVLIFFLSAFKILCNASAKDFGFVKNMVALLLASDGVMLLPEGDQGQLLLFRVGRVLFHLSYLVYALQTYGVSFASVELIVF